MLDHGSISFEQPKSLAPFHYWDCGDGTVKPLEKVEIYGLQYLEFTPI